MPLIDAILKVIFNVLQMHIVMTLIILAERNSYKMWNIVLGKESTADSQVQNRTVGTFRGH